MANVKGQNISGEKNSAATAGAQSSESAQTRDGDEFVEGNSESGLTNPNSQQSDRPQDGSPIGGGVGDFRQDQQ